MIYEHIPERKRGTYTTQCGHCSTGRVALMVGQYPATPAHGERWVEVTPAFIHLGKPACPTCFDKFCEEMGI